MRKNPSPAPGYVLQWADRARRDDGLVAWMGRRFWEHGKTDGDLRKADLQLTRKALEQLLSPQSSMTKCGAWSDLERAARGTDTPDAEIVYWVSSTILLPVQWTLFPELSRSDLRDACKGLAASAASFRQVLNKHRKALAYQHPHLVSAGSLFELTKRRKKGVHDWPPRLDLTGLFGGFRPDDYATPETVFDLVNAFEALVSRPAALNSFIYSKIPTQTRVRIRKGKRESRDGTKPKPQPIYPRRTFFISCLIALSKTCGFRLDANVISACAKDLLIAAGDYKATITLDAGYVKKRHLK